MNNILCKVYAAFSPVERISLEAIEKAAEGAVGNGEPWLFWERDMLRISFEGVYFPLEDVLAALVGLLPPGAEGRLDYLDLENWRLVRNVFTGGSFVASERGLNQVLEYSGH